MCNKAADSSKPARRPRSRSRGRATSLGGGKVQTGHRVHGFKDSSSAKKKPSRGRSKDGRKKRIEYDTPFDDKGRCHYHVNVQLASKKFNGGWKVLHAMCPKCMEEKDSDDDKSAKSGKSARSARSAKSGASSSGGKAKDSGESGVAAEKEGADSGKSDGKKFDKNGCCVVHSHIQVAKKGVLKGWKVRGTT